MTNADIYMKITKMMVSSLDNSHNLIISAACLSLAELGRSGPLPLETGEVKEAEDKAEADTKLEDNSLGDNNDLVQDAASKGIAIVYEACSEDQRDGMVNSLLDTILGKKPQEAKSFGPSVDSISCTGES